MFSHISSDVVIVIKVDLSLATFCGPFGTVPVSSIFLSLAKRMVLDH